MAWSCWPIRPSLRERSVSRCFGLIPLAERTCLTTTSAIGRSGASWSGGAAPRCRPPRRPPLGRRLARGGFRLEPSAAAPPASAAARWPVRSASGCPRTSLTLRPRSLATCSGRRRLVRPSIVALTRLIGFWVPMLFESTSRMPASSSTARTPPPAITPVPGLAGRRTTWPAPKRPMIRCGIVCPYFGHADEALAGVLDRLLDRQRHLARLAVADPDHRVLVADRDQGGEREAPTALDHLGHAVDLDHPLLEVEALRADRLDVVVHAAVE